MNFYNAEISIFSKELELTKGAFPAHSGVHTEQSWSEPTGDPKSSSSRHRQTDRQMKTDTLNTPNATVSLHQ